VPSPSLGLVNLEAKDAEVVRVAAVGEKVPHL
jgi:hypothetical protein